MVRNFIRRIRSRNSETENTYLVDIQDNRNGRDPKTMQISHSLECMATRLSGSFPKKQSLSVVAENCDFPLSVVECTSSAATSIVQPDLKQLLYSTQFRKLRVEFLLFAREFHFEENILYMLDFERLRKLRMRQSQDRSISETLVIDQAQELVDRYIIDDAEYQVYIAHSLASAAVSRVAQQDITAMMAAFARISSHLRMILEQHLLSDFLNTCDVTPAGNGTITSRRENALLKSHSLPASGWKPIRTRLTGHRLADSYDLL